MNEKRSVHVLVKAAALPEFRAAKSPSRVPVPTLPSKGVLNSAERWESLLWSINTAEQQGPDSLRGLTIALSRLIQAEMLELLLFDARGSSETALLPAGLLWDNDLPLTADGATMEQLIHPVKQAFVMNLEDAAVFPRAWNRWRLHRTLGRIGPGRVDGVYLQSDNHFGTGWYLWPLIWLENGNHSTFAAQLQGAASSRATRRSISRQCCVQSKQMVQLGTDSMTARHWGQLPRFIWQESL